MSGIYIFYPPRHLSFLMRVCELGGLERWNGTVEWTTGVEYWTGLLECHAHRCILYQCNSCLEVMFKI